MRRPPSLRGEALVTLQKKYVIEMEDVVVVTRDADGKVASCTSR